MKILAIDIGEKSLGFAISDKMLITASPLINLNFKITDIEIMINEVIKIINNDLEIEKLLIGYPKKTNGEKAAIANFIDLFIVKLKEKVKLEILLIDERFSTKRGKEKFSSKINYDQNNKDMFAAYIMLNDYLNNK